jgi:hypothetical protein
MATEIEGIKFCTILETTQVLQITTKTILSYIKQGRLRGQSIVRPILITEKNLKEFLKPSTE